jgi:hypothetical protein
VDGIQTIGATTMDIEKTEEMKKATYIKYTSMLDIAITNIYLKELDHIFRWFINKFPKRHLRRVSAMGGSFWVLDGKLIEWYHPDFDRRVKILRPLWEYDRSIEDTTNTVTWIDTGDHNSDDYKFSSLWTAAR